MKTSMIRWAGIISAVVLLAVVGAGCRAAAANAVTLQESDNLTTVQLRRGDVLTVLLEGNPTTGYRWDVASVDGAVLVQQGEAEYKETAPGKLGSGGEFTFEFKAQGSGSTQLKLIYHRPWEKDTPPEGTFEVTSIVK